MVIVNDVWVAATTHTFTTCVQKCTSFEVTSMNNYESSYSGIIDNIYDSVPLARNNRIRQIKTFVNSVKVTYNDVNFNYSFINENSDIIQLFYSNGKFRSEVKVIERKLAA